MVKFPAYSKLVCHCLSQLPIPSLSAHFILFYSLKSFSIFKKCIISIFKRKKKKKTGRERSTSLSRFLQEQEQRGSPRSMLPTQTPSGTPPPSAVAGPGTNLCPGIKVARQKHTLGDTSPLSHADAWTSDGLGPVQIWNYVYSQGVPPICFIPGLLLKKTSLIWIPSAAMLAMEKCNLMSLQRMLKHILFPGWGRRWGLAIQNLHARQSGDQVLPSDSFSRQSWTLNYFLSPTPSSS